MHAINRRVDPAVAVVVRGDRHIAEGGRAPAEMDETRGRAGDEPLAGGGAIDGDVGPAVAVVIGRDRDVGEGGGALAHLQQSAN